MGEQEVLFSPGTQFLVCKRDYDDEIQAVKIYLREINIGCRGQKTVLWFEEDHPNANYPKIVDKAHKNRVDVMTFNEMTVCNAFV